ncbi:GntR family transcriptional regulator [Cognaticolwellia beringensis]|uniref:GntR family transcriptional regulator n=1 Tax=Cognaticolwellia beringensis TaxID=1967665 RepID=A0A222GBV2_9GAMM|nr:GntR family transcriptional regulator [Cognaticolwellia beringensis]ASP49356.1 GntR family transcriptional regulator [Cognaticolwellia beringensis]
MNNKTNKNNEESIYDQILGAIFERKLLPGTRLKEEELCDIFGISRGKIRKVLHRLALENLVETIPNSGSFIAKPSIKESKEVFQARLIIESELIRELAQQFTPEKRAVLEEHLTREQSAHNAGNHNLRIRLSGEYHLLIGKLLDKTVLTELLRGIISRTSLIIALYERQKSNSGHLATEPCHDHQALINALDEGDADKAVALMRTHLLDIQNMLNLDPPPEESVNIKNIFTGQ